ncbi:uncharacterized protein SETTUDRAFT_33161 [Exserohilum turcica Et28A]|uniref:Uncharacterized protein n=1 Tax=Exserohilum turcicum (strain 28A) TaxID=671987 RepID=R0IGP3_EXST2|nr:uncharacterized protein SETTUDRAFT_33161 [Exserohilum turcica Et28A]EOA84156.1 hypothetical protein SETTUDRAFT_33161 [Exserohilum turcica Et28A]
MALHAGLCTASALGVFVLSSGVPAPCHSSSASDCLYANLRGSCYCGISSDNIHIHHSRGGARRSVLVYSKATSAIGGHGMSTMIVIMMPNVPVDTEYIPHRYNTGLLEALHAGVPENTQGIAAAG